MVRFSCWKKKSNKRNPCISPRGNVGTDIIETIISSSAVFHTIASARMCRPITNRVWAADVIGLPSPTPFLSPTTVSSAAEFAEYQPLAEGHMALFVQGWQRSVLRPFRRYGTKLDTLQHNFNSRLSKKQNTFSLILQVQLRFIVSRALCSYLKNICMHT